MIAEKVVGYDPTMVDETRCPGFMEEEVWDCSVHVTGSELCLNKIFTLTRGKDI